MTNPSDEKTVLEALMERFGVESMYDHPRDMPCSVIETARDEAAQLVAEGYEEIRGKGTWTGDWEIDDGDAEKTPSVLREFGGELARSDMVDIDNR